MLLSKVTSAAVGLVSAQRSCSSLLLTVMLQAAVVSCASARQFQLKVDMFSPSRLFTVQEDMPLSSAGLLFSKKACLTSQQELIETSSAQIL